ncbi:MAG TPA: FeoB small GTPase domain-containing protein [Candidatus Methanofastidiosa archaeon]|nr:FeoB small GTPase domain-containing protein [Candidatus Methanofastidiosa archaeon]HPR41847.1 FeoB small GTPase domain-containing protein [Candidatus Methanofastidiosa archaeon]
MNIRILLMGHPNVGKSAVFNRLSGANATESNYPGTTVGFEKSFVYVDGRETEIIDVPGTFSFTPKDRAEEVALEIFEKERDSVVICVVDATKIERGLYLALEILERGRPVVIALNMWDVAKDKEIAIDHKKMSDLLGVDVIPTIAVSGFGMKELLSAVPNAKKMDVKKIMGNALR